MKRVWKLFMTVSLMALTMLFVSACSDGGGGGAPSTALKGTAAAGAPLIGKAWLKDKLGEVQGPVDIDDKGNFEFPDVSKLTAPFLIQADGAAGGQGFLLHSVATGAGTANVNPITNMVVAASAGGKDPATVFGSQTSGTAPDVANINQTTIDAAIAAIKTMLAPLLTTYKAEAINPLTGTYVADSTNPLDVVFDAVKITMAPSATATSAPTFTVENKLSGATIATGSTTTTNITSTTATAAAIPADVTTDIQGIGTMMSSWAKTLNKGTALTAADLESFYVGTALSPAAYGFQNGHDRKNEIDGMVIGFTSELTSLLPVIKASNLALKGDVTASYPGMYKVYEIYGTFTFTSGNSGAPDGGMFVAKESATASWKFIGNGRKIDADIRPYAHKYSFSNGTKSAESGIYIYLDDFGNQGYTSARVTGPGLATGGVTFSTAATGNNSATRLAIDSNQVTSQQLGDMWGKYPLTDTAITSIANQLAAGQKVEYQIDFYTTASAGTTGAAHSFKVEITAPPVTLAELNTGDYFPKVDIPAMTGQTLSSLAALIGTNMAFTVTLPTAFTPSWAEVDVDIMNWDPTRGPTGDAEADKLVPLDNLKGTILILKPTTFTPTYAQMSCEVSDLANREFRVFAQFQ